VAYAAVSGHIALFILALKLRRKAPLIGFGIAWFYLVLAPPYLFLPQKELLVEYKTYLATPGISMIILGLFSLGENFSKLRNRYRFRNCIYTITGCWLIFLCLVTGHRRTTFQNPLTIWSDVLVKYPESCRALNNRAVAWLKKGLPQKTLNDFDLLLRMHPDYARGFENRGRLRLYLKDFSGAINDFNRTLTLLPNEPELQTARQEIEDLIKSALTEKSKVKKFNAPQKQGKNQPGPQK
jgi:tetratricopeptide (TPR) repeat protein